MTIDQVKVIEIGADAIEEVFRDQPIMAMVYPPKLMHAVVAALGRHGFIIEDRYGEDVNKSETPISSSTTAFLSGILQKALDRENRGRDA